MKAKFRIIEKSYNSIEYSIAIPEYDFSKLYCCELDNNTQIIFGNETELLELNKCFRFIADHPNVILYVPSKKPVTGYLKEYWKVLRGYDLVATHHSVQLSYKDWKQIRQRIGNGYLKEFILNDQVVERNYAKFLYKENKDVLKPLARYDTIFMISSKTVFDNISADCIDVANGGREIFDRYKAHEHAHLVQYMSIKDRRNRHMSMYVDFYDEVLWSDVIKKR